MRSLRPQNLDTNRVTDMVATCCNSAGTRMLMGATGYLILWLSSVSSSLSNRYLGGLDPMSALEYFYVTVTQGTSDDGIRFVSCFVPRPGRMDVHHMFRVLQDTCTYLPMYLRCQGMYFPFQHLTATQSWDFFLSLFPVFLERSLRRVTDRNLHWMSDWGSTILVGLAL